MFVQDWGSLISILFILFFWGTLRGLRDLSSPTRDQTRARAVKAPSPNHWTARGFPILNFLSAAHPTTTTTILVLFPLMKVCMLTYIATHFTGFKLPQT